jgi:2-polyprenyl-3-methyl-5-hydroxy-6-metoxy-1,4-benzoquinol methylase
VRDSGYDFMKREGLDNLGAPGAVGWLDRKFYADFQDSWDDDDFRRYVLSHLKAEHVLLDLGAGAGIVAQMNFRGLAKKICGLDPDERVLENAYLDEAKVGAGEQISWPDETFDIVTADNVLEHLSDPERVFAEISRVLKPGGKFLFKTPNRRHYVPFIARMTPHFFHKFYNRLRGRAYEDTFATYYRANRPVDVAAAGAGAGLKLTHFELIERRPEYLRMSAFTYLLGIGYERLVNSTDALMGLRVTFIGNLTKVN